MSLRRLVPALLAGLLLTSACGGGSSSDDDPATALNTAQQKLEDTSGVSVSLTTDDLPEGVQGLESASGALTDAPAFDGSLGVVTQIGSFSVPVKAVDGKVYAQIPLTPGWSEVDPADYGAPDPSQLISADKGIPAILAATQDPKSGKDIRGGTDNKEVLSTYTGTVPASAVAAIIPGASGDFDATYGLTSDGELRQLSLTGEFYSGESENTYRLMLTDYGTSKDITAP
ncbi:MAG TPA: LppX_LprAFG lipoprotein [Nocardioidaceae bacterium]|nr:LppX_LprAFG lipoprotein [Nocardioidaceae bacterium]